MDEVRPIPEIEQVASDLSKPEESELYARAFPIAKKISHSRATPPIQYEDLFSAANEAVWHLVRDWTGVGSFEDYAAKRITWRVLDEIRKLRGGRKNTPVFLPLEAAEVVTRSTLIRCPRCSQPVVRRAEPTCRELAIWELLSEGLSSKEIGNRLGISDKTVCSHLRRLRIVLGVPGAKQAVLGRLWAERKANNAGIPNDERAAGTKEIGPEG